MDRKANIKAIIDAKDIEETAEKLYEKKYVGILLNYFINSLNENSEKSEQNKALYSKTEKKQSKEGDYPTIWGFLTMTGLTKSVLDVWINNHVEFKRAYEMATQAQLNTLLVNALNGNFNATIAKLELTATHGMSESGSTEPVEVKLTVVDSEHV